MTLSNYPITLYFNHEISKLNLYIYIVILYYSKFISLSWCICISLVFLLIPFLSGVRIDFICFNLVFLFNLFNPSFAAFLPTCSIHSFISNSILENTSLFNYSRTRLAYFPMTLANFISNGNKANSINIHLGLDKTRPRRRRALLLYSFSVRFFFCPIQATPTNYCLINNLPGFIWFKHKPLNRNKQFMDLYSLNTNARCFHI